MKVFLVGPEGPETFWSFKHTLRIISRQARLPPLGLLTVAAMFPSTRPKKLVDMRKYACMPIHCSRGCPFCCDFCDVTKLFGHRMRTKGTGQVLAELENLYRRGWRDSVFVVDDNFIGNRKQLQEEVLPARIDWMGQRNHPFVLNTQASINLSDDEELMKLMVRAGFDTVFVGIETPNDQSRAECHNAQNRNRDLTTCVRKIQAFGWQVQAGFLPGFDSDTPSIFDRLARFIQDSGIVTAMAGLLNAPPGTKLYERLAQENRLTTRRATGDNMDLSMNFVPRMNGDELVAGYRGVVRRIDSRQLFSARVKAFLKSYQPVRTGRFRRHSYDARALLRSMWFLGVRSRGRIYYWKLLAWSLFRKPQLSSLAVTLAVQGFHLRKMFAGG
jgi:radical SAM superfamily enzyme YgiQ (UPF0313 family)